MFLVLVLSTVLMFIDHHQQHLKFLRKTITTFISPIIFLADLPSDFFAWSGERFISRGMLRTENMRLKGEMFILQAQLLKYVALQAENAKLRNLLGSQRKQIDKRLVAEILRLDDDPFSLKFTINKGSVNNVYSGQVVIDAYGIFGQVTDVSTIFSKVIMITDASHAIPLKIARNGSRVTAIGSGQIDLLTLQFVPNSIDIKVGDLLQTSGLGQKFPEGYPVAKVISVENIPGESFTRIFARPTAKLEQSAEVLLIWADKPVGAD